MKKALLFSFLLYAISAGAQLPAGLTVSGYVDAYAAFYTDSMAAGNFQKFPTYAPRSGSVGLNMAQLVFTYKTDKVRANVTLHYGDIPKVAWAPDFRAVQEANAGFHLTKKCWLDGGFFRTHIGAEGLYPKENITSSIAMPTLFEPYYEAGLKLTYQLSEKLEGRVYLLNGYNTFTENNRRKSVGLLFTYAINDSNSIVYANYAGDDTPDTTRPLHLRLYNNLCYYYSRGRWRLTAGIDQAFQEHSGGRNAHGTAAMFGVLLAARYRLSPFWNVYARAEYLDDPKGFMTGTYVDIHQNIEGLRTTGATLGAEYKPTAQSYIRLEGRLLQTDDALPLFYWNGGYTNHRYEGIFSLGIWFLKTRTAIRTAS